MFHVCNTCKLLLAISPGPILFVPELLGGTVSDEVITEKCEILDLIENGDNIMADRGFDIKELLSSKRATLNIPQFLGQGRQLTTTEVEQI